MCVCWGIKIHNMQKKIPKVVLDWIMENSDKFCISNDIGGESVFYRNPYWIEEPIEQSSDVVICNCYTNFDIPINLVNEFVANKKHMISFLRLGGNIINSI